MKTYGSAVHPASIQWAGYSFPGGKATGVRSSLFTFICYRG